MASTDRMQQRYVRLRLPRSALYEYKNVTVDAFVIYRRDPLYFPLYARSASQSSLTSDSQPDSDNSNDVGSLYEAWRSTGTIPPGHRRDKRLSELAKSAAAIPAQFKQLQQDTARREPCLCSLCKSTGI